MEYYKNKRYYRGVQAGKGDKVEEKDQYGALVVGENHVYVDSSLGRTLPITASTELGELVGARLAPIDEDLK